MICMGLVGLIRMSDSLRGVFDWPEIFTFLPIVAPRVACWGACGARTG